MQLPDVNFQRAQLIVKGMMIIAEIGDNKDKHSIFKASKILKDSKGSMYITENFPLFVREKG